MIPEEFVTFESAKLLRDAGFPKDGCSDIYQEPTGRRRNGPFGREDIYDYIPKPTQAQAMRWLREKHEISVEPHVTLDKQWMCNAWDFDTIANCVDEEMRFPSYEAAAEAAIQAACEYLIEEGDKQ